MEKEKWWKKFSAYQTVAFFVIILLVIAIIVTIGVLVDLKNKTKDAEQKNEEILSELPQDSTSESLEKIVENIYFN